MNNLDKQYQALLQDILDNGVTKQDRTGTGTISVFGRQIRHKMSEGFPLLTTKKMPFKTIVTELLWFLRGDTNIKYLVDNNCHIWDGDAIKKWMSSGKCYKFRRNLYIEPKFEILSVDEVNSEDFPYINSAGYYGFEKDGIEELWVNFSKFDSEGMKKFISDGFIYSLKTDDKFAKEWGELGPIYGKQWRSWGERKHDSISNEYFIGVDQIQNLINDLKTNPDSRRLMVNAWNVGELDQMVLPPCHYGFQMYTRELSLEEKEWQLEKTNCINDIENDRMLYGHEWEKYIQEQYESIQSTQGIKIPTRAISLMWNQRSVDTFLGLPFNIASYGLLLEIIAKEVNMVPDELIGNLGDVHLYSNHIEQAKEQIGRELTWEEKIQWVMKNTDVELENLYITEAAAALEATTRWPYPLPTLKIESEVKRKEGDCLPTYSVNDFYLENYKSHSAIKAPLSN